MIKLLFSKKNSNWDLIFVSLILVLMVTGYLWWGLFMLVVGVVGSAEGDNMLKMRDAEERIEQDQVKQSGKTWKNAALAGRRVEAIKEYNNIHKVGLKASKDAIEQYLRDFENDQ